MEEKAKMGHSTLQILTAITFTVSMPLWVNPVLSCERQDQVGDADLGLRSALAQEAWVDLVVDSTWRTFGEFGENHFYTLFRVLGKRSVDTSIFFDIVSIPGSSESRIDSISYSGEGFPDSFLFTVPELNLIQGDTLRNIFAIRMASPTHGDHFFLSGMQCKFMPVEPGPFPIGKALEALEGYYDSVALASARTEPPAHIRIGPIFVLIHGDPGLLVWANALEEAWEIRIRTGSGDCPAGCTEHEETVYRIDGSGKVSMVSTWHSSSVWRNFGTRPGKTGIPRPGGTRGRYTPEGRKLGSSGEPMARIPCLELR